MKTFFGMTAAVLLVVMMLFVALPGTGVAAKIEEGKNCRPIGAKEDVLEKKLDCYGSDIARYYQEFKCTGHGVWEKIGGRKLYTSLPCPSGETCKIKGGKAKCVKVSSSPHTP